MDLLQQLTNFQDLTGTFSVTDVVLSLVLSFALSAFIGWIYKATHRGTSYTQSYVHTLVVMGIELLNHLDFSTLFDPAFVRYTDVSDLISIDSVRSGMLTELIYSVTPKKRADLQAFLSEIKQLNGNNKVTLITDYNQTDL